MKRGFSLFGTLMVLVTFLFVAGILFMERDGIKITHFIDYNAQRPQYQLKADAQAEQEKECLLLYDSLNDASVHALENFEPMLTDMKVGYTLADLSVQSVPAFDNYNTVIVLLKNLNSLGEKALDLANWVEHGGRAMFPLTLEQEIIFSLLQRKLGILDAEGNHVTVKKMWFDPNFIIGGGRSYDIPDGYDSALNVTLSDDAVVLARADGERGVPVIWKIDYGEGRFVVDNFDLVEKINRGLYAMSYSQLEDAFAFPVLNSEVFYLDDFPSPVPEGDFERFRQDYGMRISDFYSNVWWVDIMSLAARHGIRFTGVLIEDYQDLTDGTIMPQVNTRGYQYFGNMLLQMGGEIGYHGYNHQPLALAGEYDYASIPYHGWTSRNAMRAAVTELERFTAEQFPSNKATVYVPPSNILSLTGQKMLEEEFPNIHTIASTWFTETAAHTRGQEFEQLASGMVLQPRITSGELINDYITLSALCELNMHCVNTHFVHPDDAMDPDRGADLGWEYMFNGLSKHFDWLFETAPFIRRQVGSELSQVIASWSASNVNRGLVDNVLYLTVDDDALGNFFFLRLNNGKLSEIKGGEITQINDSLYLLLATEKNITVRWD